MRRLNLSSDDVKNYKEKLRLLNKGVPNLVNKQGLLFKKSKEPNKFRASKTCKSVRKVSKTQSDNEF